ncbi:CU044_5270 family protein [Actinoallomurus purpureus]|uniref:CU044_5270 family protein n=1 Tax=Actinoallomurus purpureus TaxID=478114 RepID=UPI002092BD98|nr:CU044_5270 family protein [Actinoallomurus purpureus]MCO6008255.1 CU044_5270 family protein [Actinoallomurus purpureus]
MNSLKQMLPEVAPPSREALLEGRGRLVAEARDEAASAGRSRLLKRRINPWTALTAGLVAGTLGVGAALAVQIGGDHRPPERVRLVSAAEVLSRASAVAGADGAARHGRYFHYRWQEISLPDEKSRHVLGSGESWVPAGGNGRGLQRMQPCTEGNAPDCDVVLNYKDGATDREGFTGPRSPKYLRDLATDPDALLARIRRTAKGDGTADDRAWREITDLITESVGTEPKLRAALFAAAAKIPGVVADMNTKDAIGRPGIAISRPGRSPQQIIFDRGYRLIGDRTLAVGKGGPEPGTVLSAYVLVNEDVVDRLPAPRPGLVR